MLNTDYQHLELGISIPLLSDAWCEVKPFSSALNGSPVQSTDTMALLLRDSGFMYASSLVLCIRFRSPRNGQRKWLHCHYTQIHTEQNLYREVVNNSGTEAYRKSLYYKLKYVGNVDYCIVNMYRAWRNFCSLTDEVALVISKWSPSSSSSPRLIGLHLRLQLGLVPFLLLLLSSLPFLLFFNL